MKPVKVGIIGCGAISEIYLQVNKTFEILDIVACADLVPERAAAKAEEHGIPKACSVEELLADPGIEIVVNLTVPKAHAEVALKALEAGKCVHNEKPLTVTREDGRKMLALAQKKGLLVGGAPDTFMGAGLQTCRKLIDDGWIGDPVGATGFMLCPGHEYWHPSPEFYYEIGGGPMFDMGPYYLTALISMIGPVASVTASAKSTYPERTIFSEPKKGKKVPVETPTHIAGILNFACGAVATLVTSFDVWGTTLPSIEIYGTQGSLLVPDPNGFGGVVKVKRMGLASWQEVPLSHGYAENSRGIGVADMAYALRTGRKHRANGEMAYHVLDVMHAFLDASEQRKYIDLESSCERPAALPLGLWPGTLDE